jgi:hypothetical protein
LALPIFIVTIFVSAFLLFLVQPIVGKLILPKLGGTPQVWNTCMVFFQSALLLGYAYTHTVTTRLTLRRQLMVHCGLLIVPVLMMIAFPMYAEVQGWTFPAGSNPIVSALLLLGIIVGVPFFVVSTSAPLLQRWFAYSGHKTAKDPYFLYAASNLGSLLSLYFYPLAIEPNTLLGTQSWVWFGGYLFLAACVLYCAYTIFKLAPPDSVLAAEAAAETAKTEAPPPVGDDPAPVPAPAAEASTAVKAGPAPGAPSAGARAIQRKKGMKLGPTPAADKPGAAVVQRDVPDISYGAHAAMTPWRRIRWVFLAAVPSSLMLGVTSYISTDLSPFPLIWIIPLSLYLLSFILVYLNFWTAKKIFPFGAGYTIHDAFLYVVQPLAILYLAFLVMSHGGFDPVWSTFLLTMAFFANALGCHGELAKDRPSTRYLTEYFLLMSVGGMIGGVFNGIIAPIIFQTGVLEFNIAICVACFVRPLYMASGWFEELLYSLFPGFQSWVRAQGDEMAKSMGRPAPNSTYLFSYFLDIVFSLLLCIFVFMVCDAINFGTKAGRENLIWVMKFLPVSKTQGGMQFAFRLLVFFIPMVFCFFFAGRPMRMGLAVTALLLGYSYATVDDRRALEGGMRRTYFGLLRVQLDDEQPRDSEEQKMFRTEFAVTKDGKPYVPSYPYTFLMHGTTYHGRNYLTPKGEADKDKVNLTRLATTYYHRYGPVGIVMERYNWFKGAQNTFRADARMPATIVGQIATTVGVGNLPLAALVETQSEPPYATIGLGTGTMASYARPFQHMTYYEIDDVIRSFSLPTDEGEDRPANRDGFFTYLQNAIKRGVEQEVIMGDARQSLGREERNYANAFRYSFDFEKKKFSKPFTNPNPEDMSTADLEKLFPPKKGETFDLKAAQKAYVDSLPTPMRDNYYKVINVDAFSSDAIPVHLVTKQSIKLYLDKITEDGVLAVHTSNRHMDLVVPVSRIALALSKESQAQAQNDLDEGKVTAKELEKLFPPKEGEKFDVNKAKEAYLKSKEINVRVGKDSADRTASEGYMGHFSSEYVMIYRGDGFEKYLAALQARKNDLIKAGKMRADGGAPDGDQILNSIVEWYDPFETHNRSRGRRPIDRKITEKDALWTDDYSHILSVIRWPEWWPF